MMLTTSWLYKTCIGKDNGVESRYYQMDEYYGIKVMVNPSRTSGFCHTKSEQECRSSPAWTEAERQARIMNLLAKKRRAPKAYEILVIYDELDHCFYPAIKVEHISFCLIYSEPNGHLRKVRGLAREKIMNILYGDNAFDYSDMHESNFVFNKKLRRFMIIDFGSVYQKDHAGRMITTPAAA
jgi:hypothetical protein